MPAFINSGHFFPPLPERNEEWSRSTNSGGTYTHPAPYETAQVVGPDGTERYDTTFTIPATANGTFSVTVAGDIFASPPGSPARLFYDGVDQGIVSGVNGLRGPGTFVLASVPGVHTVSIRIGAAPIGGVTSLHVGVTYQANQPCCCILAPSPPGRCFKSNNIVCFPVSCSDGIKWYFNDGVQLTPDDITHIVDCTNGMQGLRLLGRAFNPVTSRICSVSPVPSNIDGVTLVGSCYVPNAGIDNPVLEWDGPLSSVDITIGDGVTAMAGVGLSFALANLMEPAISIVGQNAIVWPSNTTNMTVGQTRVSNPLPNGHRVSLTYVSGPNNTNAPRTNLVTGVENGQEWCLHCGIANTDQIKIRLTYI